VIDDLTVENRKLKEKLRMYEAAYSTHLEKDMLFEVKIHGLPAKKKRELEETLRSFAASIDSSSDPSAKVSPRDKNYHTSSKNTSLSSSISRPIDSAYASMSNSGPTSTSTLNRIVADRELQNQQSNKEQKIQSFLHNIPEGLLPKHSMVMTERQKKKIVVRRLEQLFTGQRGYTVGDHSQPLQQQEVSESAAMADRAASFTRSSAEGVREAHILPYEMEVDSKRPVKLADDLSHETNDSGERSDSAAGRSPDFPLEQRPTRPLDLDPDRAQIPSDNVEYLVHLGLSAPSFESGISGDVGADGDGWMYLNLLINMAQLHIINVTPDFVRSAVADVSDKFQLSRDGRKVRWRGGTDGTRFSSDSGGSSAKNGSPVDSDSLDETDRKRRKIDVGRFGSARVDISDRKSASKSAQHNPLHYEPLFHHRKASSEDLTSHGESESTHAFGNGHADESGTGRVSRVPHLQSRGTHSTSGGRVRRRTDGPIVFYSGLQFCTDLSGDRGNITTPLHGTAVGKDGYGNPTRDVLGSTSTSGALNISRTPSGSLLAFRPFKDYSKGPESLQTNEARSKTPDLLVDEDCDLDLPPEWTSCSAPSNFPMSFDASGLGGTQPADHFAVRVETRRTILDNHTKAKLSKFSAPGPGSRKFLHTIPKSALEMFQNSGRANSEDMITSGLASLSASSPAKGFQAEDLPVQTEIVSAQFYRLQPSALPPPLGYYAELSSSDSDTDGYSNSSYSGFSHLRGQKSFVTMSYNSMLNTRPKSLPAQDTGQKEQDSSEMQDDEDEDDEDDDDDDDSDESIDMLASAREVDPQTVAAREEEFEMQAARRLMALPAESLAAAVHSGSGLSSLGSESSGDNELR
jgi:hypothetical protein